MTSIWERGKRIPIFRSKMAFALLAPLLAAYIWLNFFYYGAVPEKMGDFSDAVTEVAVESFIEECKSLEVGMSVGRVIDIMGSSNKKITAEFSDKSVYKFWVARNWYKEHAATGEVCRVEFDNEGVATRIELLYINP